MEQPKVMLFDVNETLLDLAPVKERLEELFGSALAAGEWFSRLLHGSLVANQLNAYRAFGVIASEQLESMAVRYGVELEQPDSIIGLMRRLPPHADVVEGLRSISQSGIRMATLTNGSPGMVAEQLEYAGLADMFEASLSVESVGAFKPAPEVYLWAVDHLGVTPPEAMLVAAHDWDVAGAQNAGLRGAFVARAPWSLPAIIPQVHVDDLVAIADLL